MAKRTKLSELGYSEKGVVKATSDKGITGDTLGYSSPSNPVPEEHTTPSEQYTKGLIQDASQKNHIAANQNGWDQFGNMLAQTGVEALTGAVETVSYLGDIVQFQNQIKSQEQTYSNWVADYMKQVREASNAATPIYLAKENEGFQPTSSEWWAYHGGTTIGTVLGLILPGLAVGKIAKLAGASEFVANLSSTVALRCAESTMEANQVFQGSYNKLLDSGINEATAKARAGEAASKAWNTNLLFAIQDYKAFESLGKGFKSLSKGKPGGTLNAILGLGTNMATEGAEEAGQYIVQQEANRRALNVNVDYFGKDFDKRLTDYIDDEDFKTSTLLGAAGGGVFHLAGNLSSEPIEKLTKTAQSKIKGMVGRDLQQEQANSVEDTGTSQKISNVGASNTLLERVIKGDTEKYEKELEDQKTKGGLDEQGRQNYENQIKDSKYLTTEFTKLKNNPAIPAELHLPIIERHLEKAQLERLNVMFEKDLSKLESNLVTSNLVTPKELDSEFLDLKKLEVSANAYATLAKTNKEFESKAAELKAKLAKDLEVRGASLKALGLPGIDLKTTKDKELNDKAFQYVASIEKQKALIAELKELSTDAGIAKLKAKQDAKNKTAIVDALINKPDVTLAELNDAKAKTDNPVIVSAIDKKVKELTKVVKQTNKEDVDNYLDNLFGTPAELPKATKDQPLPVNEPIEPPTVEEVAKAQLAEVIDKDLASEWKVQPAPTPIRPANPIEAKVEQEVAAPPRITVEAEVASQKKAIVLKQADEALVKTWLGRFEVIENEDGSFKEWKRDAAGELVPKKWYGPHGAIAGVSTVMASTEQGIPLIDTPLVQPGDNVLLVLENAFPWTITEGYKPDVTNKDKVIINVYHADKEGNKLNKKPIAQLDNGDSVRLDEEQKKNNRMLRDAVIANDGQILSTIENKVIGMIRRLPAGKLNSLGVLESDWYNDKVQKTPYNPILLTVIDNKLNFGEASRIPASVQKELASIQNSLSKIELQAMSGFTATARRTPLGTLHLETLVARTLSSAEITWVKSMLTAAMKEDDMQLLTDVINIPFVKIKNKQPEYPTGNKKKILYGSGKLHIPSGDSWITVTKKDIPAVLAGTTQTAALEALNAALVKSFKNINAVRQNSPLGYTDPATGVEHTNYYEALKANSSLSTRLIGEMPGSQGTNGTDNSFSFVQSTVYINPKPAITKVEVDNGIIVGTTAPVVQKETPTTNTGKKSEAERKRARGRERMKPATNSSGSFRSITEKEFTWMKDHFGTEFLSIAKGLDRFIAQNGREAFGTYYDGLVTIADFAPEGTGYHEYGHFFLDPANGLITPLEKRKLLENAEKVYNIKDAYKLEERIMQEFEVYKVSNGRVKPKVERASTFFTKLLQMIKNLLGLKNPIERLFAKIDGTALTQEQKNKIVATHRAGGNLEPIRFKKLVGFDFLADQAAAINTITSHIVNSAYEAAKEKGIDIGDVFKAKMQDGNVEITGLEKLFKIQQKALVEDFNRIRAINGDDRTDNDIDRYTIYHAMGIASLAGITNDQVEELYQDNIGQWDDQKDADGIIVYGFKDKILRDFARFGFTVIPGVEDVTEDNDSSANQASEVQEEDVAGHISDQNITQVKPSKSLSSTIKLWLNSISVPKVDDNNKVVGVEKDLFGNPMQLAFARVDRNLQIKLADSQDILIRLAELSQIDPFIKVVYDKLMKERETNSKIFTEFMVKYKLNTIDAQTILQQSYSYSTPNGFLTEHQTRVIDSNRDSAYLSLVDNWKDKGLRRKVVTTAGEHNKTLFTKVEKGLASLKAIAPRVTYQELKNQFVAAFKLLEIEFTPSFWDEIEGRYTTLEARKAKPKVINDAYEEMRTQLTSWLVGSKVNSLTNAVSVSLQSDATSFYDQPIVRELARRDAKFVEGEGGHMYLASDGTQRFPINLPSFITNFNVTIQNDPHTYVEEQRRNSLLTNNKILDAINDSQNNEKIGIVEIEAYQEKGRDAKMFSDRNSIDSIKARLSSFFISAQNDDSKSPMGMFYLPTPADKSKSQALQLPRKKDADARTFFKEVILDTIKYEAHRIGVLKKYDGLREKYNNLKGMPVRNQEQETEMNSLAWLEHTVLLNDVKNINKKNVRGEFEFKYFPELENDLELKRKITARLTDGDVNSTEYTQAVEDVNKYADDYINRQYDFFVNFLVDNSLLRKVGGKIKNNKLPKGIFIKKEEKNGKIVYTSIDNPTEAQIHSVLKDFFFNDTAWQLEMSKLFMGDLALYKNDVDYFKRAYQLVTPGYEGFTEEPVVLNRMVFASQKKENSPETLASIAQLIDPKITATQIADHIKNNNSTNAVVQLVSKYAVVDKADAQTYATIEAFRDIAKSVGQWSNQLEQIYNISWAKDIPASRGIKEWLEKETSSIREREYLEKLDPDQVKEMLQELKVRAGELRYAANKAITTALKPFQFNDMELQGPDGTSMFVKEQVKDSISPIFPELYAFENPTHKGFKDLVTFMRANKVQLASDESTTKVGLYGTTDLSSPLQSWQVRQANLKDIRFPQLLPSKVKEEASGSQFHKLIVGDIQDDTIYIVNDKSLTGKEVKSQYNDLWVEKLQKASSKLQDDLGVGASYKFSEDPRVFKKQLLKLSEFLRKELISRDLDENYLETLKLVKQSIDKIDFTVPLSFPQFGDRIQGILTNIFKREIIKVKSPGYVAVNMADFGIGYSDELQFIKNKDGKVEAAEIGLSVSFLKDIKLEPTKHYAPNGRIYWDKLSREQQKALEFIAYRIPTSSKSSMLPVRIAVVLPVQMSNTVLIPGELTAQMGLDFDVDKTQLLRRELNVEGKVANASIDNKLFDLYWSILTNPVHTMEMIQPLTTAELEAIEAELEILGVMDNSKWSVFTMPANVQTEDKNKGEKVKVGINSRSATLHSVLTNIPDEQKPRVTFGISINGNIPNTLGNRLNTAGELISGLLGESLQAALDAAKKPLLALFNINKAYMFSFENMIMAGYPLRTAVHFFMQPIIKEYITMYNQENGSERLALESLFKKYKKLETVYKQIEAAAEDARKQGGYYRPEIQAQALTDELTGSVDTSETHSALVLYEFLQNALQARSLVSMSDVLSVDTLNDLTSIEALQSFEHKVSKLITPKEGGATFPASLLDLETAPPTTRRLAAFIKYAIEDARAFTEQIFPSLDYVKHQDYIAQQLNMSEITDQKTLKIINQFINFYQLNQNDKLRLALQGNHPLFSSTPELDQSNPMNRVKKRWSIMAKETEDSIIGYMDKVVREINRPSLTNNKVISTLKARPNKDGIIVLGLINTSSDKNKTDLINDFDELLHHEDIRVRILAHDLARYAILTSGMSFSTASFVNIIPVSFFVENGLGELWRNKLAGDHFDIDQEAMFINLVRNKAESIKNFPELYNEDLMVAKSLHYKTYNDVKVVEGFSILEKALKGKERGPRVYIYKGNLYEANPMNPTEYKLLQRAGERFYTQVSPVGREESRLNKIGDPDPWNSQTGQISSTPQVKTYHLEHKADDFGDLDTLFHDPREADINPRIADYLPEGSNTTSVLEQLLSEETDTQTRDIINALLRNKDKINTPIFVQEVEGAFGAFQASLVDGKVVTAININPYAHTDAETTTRKVLLHEIIHAYTVGVLDNPIGEEQEAFNRNISRLTIDARAKLGDIQGTQDKFEFIAELASDKNFRDKLRKADLWSRVIRQLRNLFGFKDIYDKTLEELYKVLDKAQDLQVGEGLFKLEIKKEEKKGPKKILSSFDKVIATLKGEIDALRQLGEKERSKSLFDRVKRLQKIGEANHIVAKVSYFSYVKTQQNFIEKKIAELHKNLSAKKKLNTKEIRHMRNQLLSYSDLLNDIYLEFLQLPIDQFPPGVTEDLFMKDASILRDRMVSLSNDIQRLSEEGEYQFAVTYLGAEKVNRDEFLQNLRIADRDISWWSRMTRSGIDVVDQVIQASAIAIQSAFRNAHKKMQELLYTEKPSNQVAEIAYREPNTDAHGNVLKTKTGKVATHWATQRLAYTRVNKIKAMDDFLAMRGSAHTIRDKYAPVLDPLSFAEGSDGVRFIDPFSPEGQRILKITPTSTEYPLRQFYETFVIDYLASQEAIKIKSERPGLRLPTVGKSLLEGIIGIDSAKSLGLLAQEKVMANFIERADESEYAMVNQHLEPANRMPIRFSSKHDGKNGRFRTDQISLDVVATTLLFQNEMLRREELQKIQADLETSEDILRHREVLETKRSSVLSSEDYGIEQNGGEAGFKSMKGAASNAYAMIKDMNEKSLYGKRKKQQKGARILDFLTKVSGLNIMMGNIAIPLTNAFMGNYALITEAVGGNIINGTNLKNGYKLFKNEALSFGKDFGKKVKGTQFGKLMAYFNPLDRTEGFQSISIDGHFLRDSFNVFVNTGGNIVENELAVVTMGAVMDRYKITTPEGKEVAFNEGIEIDEKGKLTLKKGHTYEGKKTITNQQIDKVLHNVIKLYHLTSGVYNDLDAGMVKRDMWGRAITFMRNWLPAGLDARYRRRFPDARLGGQMNEGQYISAAVAFKNLFGRNGFIDATLKSIRLLSWMGVSNPETLLLPNELGLEEEQKQEIINLRKANIRKALFQLYTIATLSALLFVGEDDDDSYMQYMMARIKREIMTFGSPMTAWEVLRSPTVLMNTIQTTWRAGGSTAEALWDVSLGDGEINIKERGKGKGMPKWLYDGSKLIGASSLYQFDDLDTSTRLINDGSFR